MRTLVGQLNSEYLLYKRRKNNETTNHSNTTTNSSVHHIVRGILSNQCSQGKGSTDRSVKRHAARIEQQGARISEGAWCHFGRHRKGE